MRRSLLAPALALGLATACSPKPIPDADGPGSALPAASGGSAGAAPNLFSPENRPRQAAKPLPVSPSSTLLSAVAVTDEGDAAISADDLGDMRLWPSLDGRREPVPLRGAHPVEIALGHVGDDLIAPALDAAGFVTLLRFSRDGGMIDRQQLPGDVRAIEAIVAGELVLVRRADQTIEAYDATGAPRGRLVPPPGEQIGQLVARHGAVLAVTGGDDGFRTLRAIDVKPTDATAIAWGKTVALPVPVDRVALSPMLDRIAIVSAIDAMVTIYTLDGMKKLGEIDGTNAGGQTFALGFIDDNHLAIDRGALQWWTAPATASGSGSGSSTGSDSGSGGINEMPQQSVPTVRFERGGRMSLQNESAIGDGVVVGSANNALQLTTPEHTQWLGYKDIPNGQLTPVGDLFATSPDSRRIVWVDRDLRVVRSFEPDQSQPGRWMMPPAALGDHHVVMATVSETAMTFELADASKAGASVQIGDSIPASGIGQIEVVHDTLLMHAPDGQTVLRYHVDVGNESATKLAPVALPLGVIVRWVDPDRNDGVFAYASLPRDDGYHVATFREGKPGSTATIQPTVDKASHGYVFAFDDSGHSFTFTGTGIEIRDRSGATTTTVNATGISNVGTVSPDGKAIAFLGNHEVIGLDVKSGERWRVPLWQPTSVTYTSDGARVLVGTPTGFVILDAATGKRLDARCGWSFGLWDVQPAVRVFGQAPVCIEQ